MSKIGKILVFVVLGLEFVSCKEMLAPFQAMSGPTPCDPDRSVYQADSHYFERDFLKVDGSIDYKKLSRLTEPRSSPCDPLYDPNLVHTNPAEN